MTLRHPVLELIDNRREGDGIFLRIHIVHIIKCVAVCCRVLQYVAGCCSHYTVLDRVGNSCQGRRHFVREHIVNMIICVAGCCRVLQGVVRRCRYFAGRRHFVHEHVVHIIICIAGCCSVLQGVTVISQGDGILCEYTRIYTYSKET